MALELKISVSSYDRETHTIEVSDATGDYSVENTTGYGAPNPERSDLANFLAIIRNNSGSSEIAYIDPFSDTSYTHQFGSDGVYKLYLCTIDSEVGAYDVSVMDVGRVFYSVADDKVYKVVLNTEDEKELEETTDIISDTQYISEVEYYLVKSFLENKRFNYFCIDITSCGGKLSDEYIDVVKAKEAMECYFYGGFYNMADDVAIFSVKISK